MAVRRQRRFGQKKAPVERGLLHSCVSLSAAHAPNMAAAMATETGRPMTAAMQCPAPTGPIGPVDHRPANDHVSLRGRASDHAAVAITMFAGNSRGRGLLHNLLA